MPEPVEHQSGGEAIAPNRVNGATTARPVLLAEQSHGPVRELAAEASRMTEARSRLSDAAWRASCHSSTRVAKMPGKNPQSASG